MPCIPDLSESKYSLFFHIRSPVHGLHSHSNEGLFIIFPKFKAKAILVTDDIYLDAVPIHPPISHDDCCQHSTLSIALDDTTDIVCHVTQFQDEVQHEAKNIDNLLKSLRRYYKGVKTKRQLNLDVPAGFQYFATELSGFYSFKENSICCYYVPFGFIG